MKIVIFAFLLALTGCATSVGNVQSKDNVALLIGVTSGVGSALNPLASNSSVSFSHLNGNSLSSFMGAVNPGSIEVNPGEHTVTVLCFIAWRGMNIRGKHDFTENFEAGVVYYFEPVLKDGGQCGLQMHADKNA